MKRIFLIALLLSGIYCYSQDASNKYTVDSTLFLITSQSFAKSRPFLYHMPMAKDQENINEFAYLMDQQPTETNYKSYHKLACSLWQLNKLNEAEKMLLTIVGSQEKYYTGTYRSGSDVPGDTSGSLYGYGSYTFNYKNGAALYLAKLYLEQKNYTKALQYLEDAVKKYTVTYTCGTGIVFQQEEYTALYAYCYEGLKDDSKLLDILLPHFYNTHDEMLIPTIKRLYKQKEIDSHLQTAVNTIHCTFDTLQTLVVQSNNEGTRDTINYYDGHATINLFGRSVTLYAPARKNIKRITKEHLIECFKESRFYQQLADTVHPSQQTTLNFVPSDRHKLREYLYAYVARR